MKVEEIPINIQVARALGFQTRDMTKVWLCRGQHIGSPSDDGAFPSPRDAGEHEHRSGGWEIFKPYAYEDDGDWVPCPHYLSSWEATGPLLDKYDIGIAKTVNMNLYIAYVMGNAENADDHGQGLTRLAAVCDLIIKLNPRDYVRS